MAMMLQDGSRGEAHQQTVRLGCERVAIPEVIFSPQDIGILQGGLPAAAAAAIAASPLGNATRRCFLLCQSVLHRV